ncbi:hypothetical protein BSNT_09999 [Bacillus subtilis subsp. natto BEST195]|nr:hypothetical protein BSNT_09999 [Bacillus subtilis subsp. natto BEST195]
MIRTTETEPQMVQSFYMAARGLCALDICEKESKIFY